MPEPIVTLSEESLRSDLRELVRRTVEEMLNGLLDEEAGDLVGAERYERTADREAYRAGHYERKLATTSGEVTIRMPKLKGVRFTTATIERCRRRGGVRGVGRVLARVPLLAEVAGAARRAHVRRRQGRRDGRRDRRGLPGAAYQRCTVRFYRNVLARGSPSPGAPRSPPCSRPHTPWSRARPPRPRPPRSPGSSSA